jgi:SAM-dependent methyltransferase
MSDESRFHDASYDWAFNAFLACTNEKEVLAQHILERIQANGVKSLLDIGAGNGDLALPLSYVVDRYMAIEQKESYAAQLRAADLVVIQEKFPLPMEQQFDMVLTCHSTPWKSNEYQPFLTSAFERVNDGGSLLIVTYDDEESEWNELLVSCGLRTKELRPKERRLSGLELFLLSLDAVQTQVVTTHVRSKQFADISAALSFVYCEGVPSREEEFVGVLPKLADHLRSRYWHDGIFEFPFHHIILEVTKTASL